MKTKQNNELPTATSGARVTPFSDLAFSVDESPTNRQCVAQYIRVLRQNWRQGTVACKGRADVAFSNKKPFKQKGTGRARQGASSSPLLRKGGVIFGPQPRTRELAIPQKMRALALRILWGGLVKGERVHCVSYDMPVDALPKTAPFARLLAQAGFAGKKVAFLTTRDDQHVHASCGNIPGVHLYLFDQLNAYALANTDVVVCLERDRERLKGMVDSWT